MDMTCLKGRTPNSQVFPTFVGLVHQTRMAQGVVNRCAGAILKTTERQAHFFAAETQTRHGVLRADKTGFGKDRLVQRLRLILNVAGAVVVNVATSHLHLGTKPWCYICRYRDTAYPPLGVEAGRGCVLP